VFLDFLTQWGLPVALGFVLGVLLVVALAFAGLFIAGSVYALAVGVKRAVKELACRIRPRRRKSARVKN
jgi:hypothetical protein